LATCPKKRGRVLTSSTSDAYDFFKFDAKLFINIPATYYYIRGANKSMTDIQSAVKEKGVGADCIKIELFGTGDL
jgi:nitric oxide dioxygenase